MSIELQYSVSARCAGKLPESITLKNNRLGSVWCSPALPLFPVVPSRQLEHLTPRGNTRPLMNMERNRTHAAHWTVSLIQRFILLLRGSFEMQRACKLWSADRWVQSYWKPFTCKSVWGWGRDRGRSRREGKPLFTRAGLRVYKEKETPLPRGCGAADVTHTSASDKERGCISVKRNVLWMCAALPV